eukprot:TRINITY_DN20770_c0_g1_i1.p1 TRINITY_DN20770_c0_g1~~TRINITY_DN20770_c0_g1_i1.p1  ORF type:complete len:279 (+),score=41.51 TRINITY_DN20770_c0_g1_i1:181-1017(+)
MPPRKRPAHCHESALHVGLYGLLRIPPRTSDVAVIRRAYRVLARELHPDKHPEDTETATCAFQKLKAAFDVLVDPVKRERYDRTGEHDGIDATSLSRAYSFVDEFSRRVPDDEFRKMLEELEVEYKGSEEERSAVVEFVRKQSGNATNLLDHIILSTLEDADRFEGIVRSAFNSGELSPGFRTKFDATLGAMRRRAAKERALFEKDQRRSSERNSDHGLTDLALAIRSSGSRRAQAGVGGGVLASILAAGIPEDPLGKCAIGPAKTVNDGRGKRQKRL